MKQYVVTALQKFTGRRIEFTLPNTLCETQKTLSEYTNSRQHKKKKNYSHFKIEEVNQIINQ